MSVRVSITDVRQQNLKSTLLRFAAAVAIAVPLSCTVLFAHVYPCGYFDANSQVYAGYGHHSLFTVQANRLSWDTSSVPVMYEKYTGSGPYVVEAGLWVAILYVPIFLAIAYLGWLVFSRFAEILALFKIKDPNPLSRR